MGSPEQMLSKPNMLFATSDSGSGILSHSQPRLDTQPKITPSPQDPRVIAQEKEEGGLAKKLLSGLVRVATRVPRSSEQYPDTKTFKPIQPKK